MVQVEQWSATCGSWATCDHLTYNGSNLVLLCLRLGNKIVSHIMFLCPPIAITIHPTGGQVFLTIYFFFVILCSSFYCNTSWTFVLISVVRRESNSVAYFAGMFRLANVEYIPEYRHTESVEFVSMASKIQHVVCVSVSSVICTVVNVKAEGASVIIVGLPQVTSVYKMSSVGKLHKYTVISDLRYSGLLVINTVRPNTDDNYLF